MTWIDPSHINEIFAIHDRVSAAWSSWGAVNACLDSPDTLYAVNEYPDFWGITLHALFATTFIGLHQLHEERGKYDILSIPEILAGRFGKPPAEVKARVEALLVPRRPTLGKIHRVRHKLLAHRAPNLHCNALFERLGLTRNQISLTIEVTGKVLQDLRFSNEDVFEEVLSSAPGDDATALIETLKRNPRYPVIEPF